MNHWNNKRLSNPKQLEVKKQKEGKRKKGKERERKKKRGRSKERNQVPRRLALHFIKYFLAIELFFFFLNNFFLHFSPLFPEKGNRREREREREREIHFQCECVNKALQSSRGIE